MEVWVVETVTGDLVDVVDASACVWQVALGGVGSLEVGVPVGGMSAADARETWARLSPWRHALALVADEGVVEAGPIVMPSQVLGGGFAARAAGMWSLLDRRLVGDLDVVGESLGSIVVALLEHGTQGPGRGLPLVLPARSGGSHERHYVGSDLGTVWQRVQQVSQVIGGPEVALEPRVRADGLGIEWVLRLGGPLLGQVGADWALDAGGGHGQVSALAVEADGSSMASTVVAVGDRTEDSDLPLMATSAVVLAGTPVLERGITRETVTRQSTLDSHAQAERVRSSAPWSTWSLSVAPGEGFPTGRVRCGDWATVTVDESSRSVAPGPYRSRVVGMSGGMSGHVRVSLVPTLGVR